MSICSVKPSEAIKKIAADLNKSLSVTVIEDESDTDQGDSITASLKSRGYAVLLYFQEAVSNGDRRGLARLTSTVIASVLSDTAILKTKEAMSPLELAEKVFISLRDSETVNKVRSENVHPKPLQQVTAEHGRHQFDISLNIETTIN